MSVCAAETKVGGAYIAAVTEAAPALPEIAEVEEETELAEEPPIAPPGQSIIYTELLLAQAKPHAGRLFFDLVSAIRI